MQLLLQHFIICFCAYYVHSCTQLHDGQGYKITVTAYYTGKHMANSKTGIMYHKGDKLLALLNTTMNFQVP